MLVIALFVLWHAGLCTLGFASLMIDMAVVDDTCGSKSHIWKYAFLNIATSITTVSTFGFFPGGGEGARARALSIIILHAAFAVWGVLMWEAVSDSCLKTITIKFKYISAFQELCIAHNCVFLIGMLLHELWLGEALGGDLTLFPDLVMYRHRKLDNYINPPEHKPLKVGDFPPAELSELVEAAHQHFMAPLDQPALGVENA